MAIQTINPFNNELVENFQEIPLESVTANIAIADKTFKSWRKTSFAQRADLLKGVAKLMREQSDQLARLITLEMGKLLAQSYGEISLSAAIFDYYAVNGESFLRDENLDTQYGEAYIKYSPIGVLLGVETYNFPFYQVARFTAPNLMAGNVVLIKHASNVPQCALAIQDLFMQAGAPKGLYTNLFICSTKVEGIVADPRVKGVSLTGSRTPGASVAATAAGKYLKKVVLELGGIDTFIVLEDADIDKAVEWVVIGRMNNRCQCSLAAKRIIALEAVAEEFLQKFTAKLKALKVGDPMDESTGLGPLSSEGAVIKLIEQVQRSVRAGAKVLLGGKLINRKGAFIEATILGNVKPGMVAYDEELFGPVASFYTAKNDQEAIDLANDSAFGLGGNIFTSDIERGKRLAEQIDTALVFINHPTCTPLDLPFGGTKESGYGRELASVDIREFVNKKLIRITKLTDLF